MWYVYILKCYDGSFYTGITSDINRRIKEHNFDDKKASKYVKVRRPAYIIYQEQFKTKSKALKRENEIKGIRRQKKIELISGAVSKKRKEFEPAPESRSAGRRARSSTGRATPS